MRNSYLLLPLLLAACDTMPTEAPTTKQTTTAATISVAPWRVCATGLAPEPNCPRCPKGTFEWGVEIRLSRGDTIDLRTDSARCRDLGAFPDTLRFQVLGIIRSGILDQIWFEANSDSIPLKWSGRWNADSLRALRWEE